MPTTSVIIPTFNRERLVARAVESVLAQTLPPDEVIVIDDGSTDGTHDALAVFGNRIRYIFQPNAGVSAARNHGLREATGRYVGFLDSDDEWLPHKLERQVAFLESHPEIDFVGCPGTTDDRVVPLNLFRDPSQQFRQFLIRPYFANPSRYLVRRECFEKFGLFDESMRCAEDWELWLRFLHHGCRFAALDDPLMVYHVMPDALSADPVKSLSGESVLRDRYIPLLPTWWDRIRVRSRFNARMYRNAALGFRSRGRLGKAMSTMLRSLAANPFRPSPTTRLAWLASLIGQFAKQSLLTPPLAAFQVISPLHEGEAGGVAGDTRSSLVQNSH
jgi:glycosyltransferase involved in cell wall biosynthesis